MDSTCTVVRGRTVLDDTVLDDGVVAWQGKSIVWVGSSAELDAAPESVRTASTVVTEGHLFLPGLVDVHCHGGGGASFPNAQTAEEAMVAIHEHRRHGTTSLVASCVTDAPDVLLAQARMLGALADADELAGVHFEGPFVSARRCGAQDPMFICDPDVALTRKLLETCGGHAVTMTLAPEMPGAYGPGSVAEALIEGGALPSWGHTDATPGPTRSAVEYSRATLDATSHDVRRSPRATVTHLFNGMRPLHHRDPGPVPEFLSAAARGDAVVEMICDGVHLDPSLVRDIYETVGRDHCVLVTDAMAAAGMADGSYRLGSLAVTVTDGVARLEEGGAIAGGTSHLLDCVRVAVRQAGIPLVDAVHMASARGAAILGDPTIGHLARGMRADVVEVDDELRVLRVWRRGELVH